VTIYIYTQVKSRPTHGGVDLSKRVWVRIDRYNPQLTLRDVHDKISEIQRENPELDVFFDGDEFAICSRPRSDPPRPSTLEDD
jgi:hypothetical protein